MCKKEEARKKRGKAHMKTIETAENIGTVHTHTHTIYFTEQNWWTVWRERELYFKQKSTALVGSLTSNSIKENKGRNTFYIDMQITDYKK